MPRCVSSPFSDGELGAWPPSSSLATSIDLSSTSNGVSPPERTHPWRGAMTRSMSDMLAAPLRIEPHGIISTCLGPYAFSAASDTSWMSCSASLRGMRCLKSSTYCRPSLCVLVNWSSSCRARRSSRLRQPAWNHLLATDSPAPWMQVNSCKICVAASPCIALSRFKLPVSSSSRHFSRVLGPRPEIRSKSSGCLNGSGHVLTNLSAFASCQLRHRSPRAE
mmetsp:Transcript_78310/g.172837  ORF Transcript_78310/g.172837 Transcript_78310/m.172837 type:complete len:221 (-) Transcript_78310:371-1033(-)